MDEQATNEIPAAGTRALAAQRPKRKNASARLLTPAELQEWYRWLNTHIEHKRLLVAQNALPRSSRRLMRVRAQAAYVTRGMRWWDAMTLRERLEALRAADTTEPAEAWHWREAHRMRAIHQEAMRRPITTGSGENFRVAKSVEVHHA
jgi:hypothetical protein